MSWRLYFGCQLAFHSTVALDLQTRYRYGFYDSLVIAAALDAGCTRLYSENLQDGQRIEGLTVENPFREL